MSQNVNVNVTFVSSHLAEIQPRGKSTGGEINSFPFVPFSEQRITHIPDRERAISLNVVARY